MIQKEVIKKIKKIEIYTNRIVTEQLSGQYHSIFKGKGLNFLDVRQYQFGDDIRDIDWKVSAKMQNLYVKQYIEERELTVNLLIDVSGSGIFGTQDVSKSERMAEIASMIAFSAIKNNDKVGLILFSDKIEKYIPPKKGRKHVLNVISQILTYKPESNKTSINTALTFFASVNKKTSVAFMISDFFDENFEKSLKIVNKKHDFIPVIIRDNIEENIFDLGIVNFIDPETNEIFTVDTSDDVFRKNYNELMTTSTTNLLNTLKKLDMDYIKIDLNSSYTDSIVYFFKKRASRKRRK